MHSFQRLLTLTAIAIMLVPTTRAEALPQGSINRSFQIADEWLTLDQYVANARKMGCAVQAVKDGSKKTPDSEYRTLKFGPYEIWLATNGEQYGSGIPGPGKTFLPLSWPWSDTFGKNYRFAGYAKDRKTLCLIYTQGTANIPGMAVFDKKTVRADEDPVRWVRRGG